MKYYWLSPRDQRNNNWIIYHESVTVGVRLRDRYKEIACSYCHKVDEIQAVESGLENNIRIRARSDFLLTQDGFVCLSRKGQQILAEFSIGGIRLHPIPGSDYAIVLPAVLVPTDLAHCGMEFHRKCVKCGRYRQTCLSPSLSSMTIPQSGQSLLCPAVLRENGYGRVFWYFVAESVARLLQSKKFSGVDYVSA